MSHENESALDSMALCEVTEGIVNVKVLRSGKKVIVIRRGDEIRAFGELCPHMGADMSEAEYCARDRTLRCPWHGYVFCADDGRFLENPNEKFTALLRTPSKHFKPEKTPRYRLTSVPVSVRDGRVYFGREVRIEGAEGILSTEPLASGDRA